MTCFCWEWPSGNKILVLKEDSLKISQEPSTKLSGRSIWSPIFSLKVIETQRASSGLQAAAAAVPWPERRCLKDGLCSRLL